MTEIFSFFFKFENQGHDDRAGDRCDRVESTPFPPLLLLISSSSAARLLMVATATDDKQCQEACIRGMSGFRSSRAKQLKPINVDTAWIPQDFLSLGFFLARSMYFASIRDVLMKETKKGRKGVATKPRAVRAGGTFG